MSRYDWLLALHVLSAFALVAGIVFFTILLAALWGTDSPRRVATLFTIGKPAAILVGAGSVLVLVFGIALAVDVDGYHLWDGWILGAIVLWAIAVGLGMRGGKHYRQAQDVANALVTRGDDSRSAELRALIRDRTAMLMHAVAGVALLAILVLMIYKPGA